MIYENILEIAQKKQLSIRQIESKAGLSFGAIGKWKTRSPQVDNLMAVAKVLNVPINKLLEDKK